ncbi:androgen-induced protein [Anaeramoeba ignava]|uniref:Androgen-induced protein n=1 Tax=Anaeramoeba ignava TaxID=1746090 RepID=A0A9Q0LRU4_ANAIG|nr:androgen-induced protein [Anaeramoeba ignava]
MNFKRIFLFNFHLFIVIASTISYFWISSITTFGIRSLQFYTIWNLLTVLFFYAKNLYKDIQLFRTGKTSDSSTSLLTLVFVMNIIMEIVFWSLTLYDPTLILPKTFVIPPVLNHFLHTFPLFYDFIEIFFLPEYFAKMSSKYLDFLFVLLLALGYALVSFSVTFIYGDVIYPFLSMMSPLFFFIFFLVATIFAYSFVMLSRKLISTGISRNLKKKEEEKKDN